MAGKTEGLCNGRVGAGVRTCTVGLGAEGRSQVVEIGERTLLIFVESNDLERGVTWRQRVGAKWRCTVGLRGRERARRDVYALAFEFGRGERFCNGMLY